MEKRSRRSNRRRLIAWQTVRLISFDQNPFTISLSSRIAHQLSDHVQSALALVTDGTPLRFPCGFPHFTARARFDYRETKSYEEVFRFGLGGEFFDAKVGRDIDDDCHGTLCSGLLVTEKLVYDPGAQANADEVSSKLR
jgi:hypothetical protein